MRVLSFLFSKKYQDKQLKLEWSLVGALQDSFNKYRGTETKK